MEILGSYFKLVHEIRLVARIYGENRGVPYLSEDTAFTVRQEHSHILVEWLACDVVCDVMIPISHLFNRDWVESDNRKSNIERVKRNLAQSIHRLEGTRTTQTRLEAVSESLLEEIAKAEAFLKQTE